MKLVDLAGRPAETALLANGRRSEAGRVESVAWHLAEESAVVVLLNGESFAVMMATPSDLEDFAVGFLISERVIATAADFLELRLMPVDEGVAVNCIVSPDIAGDAAARRKRSFAGRSGCGLCGLETLGAALPTLPTVSGQIPTPDEVVAAFDALAGLQPLNALNHSTHAAAFFALDGGFRLAREDVGRHNALDKLGGALARTGIDPASGFIVLSSRMSVEMVQKAVIFGVPLLASLSAPTDLALRTALVVCARSGKGVVFFDGAGADPAPL
jgi:FdhD protein